MPDSNRILITGACGQLGGAFEEILTERKAEFLSLRIEDLDVTNKPACLSIVKDYRPDVIINCAAYTAVDLAEDNEDKARAVNADGVANIVDAANNVSAAVIHFSTDFVFDGKKGRPYKESDTPSPLSAYGRSKLAGEKIIQEQSRDYVIIRTAWLFGPHGSNFVETIRRLAEERDELRIVSDQIGSPTYTIDLAEGTLKIIEKRLRGIFHLANHGSASWFDLALETVRRSGCQTPIIPIKASEYPRKAVTPDSSVLNCSALARHGIELRPWQEAVVDHIKRKKKI